MLRYTYITARIHNATQPYSKKTTQHIHTKQHNTHSKKAGLWARHPPATTDCVELSSSSWQVCPRDGLFSMALELFDWTCIIRKVCMLFLGANHCPTDHDTIGFLFTCSLSNLSLGSVFILVLCKVVVLNLFFFNRSAPAGAESD